jgi:hypothetical protein
MREGLMRSRTYEITFVGHAGPVLAAVFNDCQVTTNPSTTTVRTELPDPHALNELMGRITDLGLKVIRIRFVIPPPSPLSP